MAKTRKPILGKMISKGVVEVKVSDRNSLVHGQKVLIYQPTNKNIMGLSGKPIGKKEIVLGTGKVKIDGTKLLIETPNLQNIPIHPKTIKRSAIRGRANYRAGKFKAPATLKAYQPSVLIKPVEE